jgi:hypothetical protein
MPGTSIGPADCGAAALRLPTHRTPRTAGTPPVGAGRREQQGLLTPSGRYFQDQPPPVDALDPVGAVQCVARRTTCLDPAWREPRSSRRP